MNFALLKKSFLIWLPIALVVIMVDFTVYAVVQQDYRQNANDPQIQIATDLVAQLNSGRMPGSLVSGSKVDLANSLATFSVIYTSDKKVAASGATLDKADPIPPAGTFDFAKTHGQDWFSWQPKNDVRIAAVLMPYKDGYVLSGRSLKQVEYRESALSNDVLISLLGTLVVSYLAVVFGKYYLSKEK